MLQVLASACPPPSAALVSPGFGDSSAALSPLIYDDESPQGGAAGALPSGSEFHAAYFASARWVAGHLSLESRLSELSLQVTGAGGTSARLTLGWPAQYAALASREWRSAYRDLPYNMGRILALIGLQVFYGIGAQREGEGGVTTLRQHPSPRLCSLRRHKLQGYRYRRTAVARIRDIQHDGLCGAGSLQGW